MVNFEYYTPTKVVFGKDTEKEVGQLVKAYVVLTPGKEGTPELVKEIQEYVKQHTAPYKYPRAVEFIAAMPKTISGKIKRNELRKR